MTQKTWRRKSALVDLQEPRRFANPFRDTPADAPRAIIICNTEVILYYLYKAVADVFEGARPSRVFRRSPGSLGAFCDGIVAYWSVAA